jgi:hypothetical protein
MDFLPKSTYLGKLELIEVYEAFDEPCLFSCQNASGQIFLAVLIDEDEEQKKWLYSSLSRKRFEYLRSGGVDLHDCFKLAEDELAHIIEVPFLEGKSVVTAIPCSELSENMLPLAGEFLKLETQTLPILHSDTLKTIAMSSWREILRFRVESSDSKRNEAPVKTWGKTLVSLQAVIESIGRQIKHETIKGPFTKIIEQETRLLATVTSGGSYCIDLMADASANVLRESLVGDSINVFFNILRSTDFSSESIELETERGGDLTESLNKLGRHFTSRYRVFLNCIADMESNVDFGWGSPHPERGGHVKLTYLDAINALYLINRMEIAAPEILEVTGVLIGGNVESKRFELRDIYDEVKYRGDIDDSLLASSIDKTLDNIYRATIEERIEVNIATGESKPKHKLINLRGLKLASNDELDLYDSDSSHFLREA